MIPGLPTCLEKRTMGQPCFYTRESDAEHLL
jgi:hypothetical protein